MLHEINNNSAPKCASESPGQLKKQYRKKKKKHDYLHWLAEPFNSVRGEKALWTAVITQAMMDALSNSRNPETIYEKREAIHWLTENTKDFTLVCLFAGMDPDYIRQCAKRTIANPVPWRAQAGKGSRYEERKAYRKRIKQQQQESFDESCTATIADTSNIITGCWQ